MIKACSRESNLKGALEVFERLKASGASMSSMTYNSILDACIQCRDAPKALELFQQMRSEGVFDIVSFNIMLKMYLREGKKYSSAGVAARDEKPRSTTQQDYVQRTYQYQGG